MVTPLLAPADTTPADTSPWRVLLMTSAMHACNDAFFYVLYPLLPFMAAELGLSYTQIGLVNAAFAGSSAVLQLPAGLLGERFGEYLLLAWGNGWVAAGLGAMALAGTFPLLLVAAVLGGLGGNLQHPLAAALVARAYEGRRRGVAIGTLNFSGDLGKLAAPALVTLVTLAFGWRATLAALGAFGIAFSVVFALGQTWARPPTPQRHQVPGPAFVGPSGVLDDRAARPRRFGLAAGYGRLTGVGMLDATTRTAALTFLPFVLASRGVGSAEIGLLFGVLFAGGAAGKFLCGVVGDRLGTFAVVLVTEVCAALALIGFLWAPLNLEVVVTLAVILGFGLNGTSSVLYAAVASLVPDGKRGSGYGIYYTGTQLAASGAALAYGIVADHLGLEWTFLGMAALTLAIVPLAAPIRRYLAAGQ
jgi:MFS transporter, FSR family, fosmidomycin resistance protein